MLSFWRRRLPLFANLQTFNTFPTTSIASKKFFKQHNFPFHTSVQEPRTSAMTHIQESFGNFDLVKRLKLDFTDVLVSKWRSRCTGLTVIHLDYDGLLFCLSCIWEVANFVLVVAPIVHGYFVVATESRYLIFQFSIPLTWLASLRWFWMSTYVGTVSDHSFLILLISIDQMLFISVWYSWDLRNTLTKAYWTFLQTVGFLKEQMHGRL